MTNNTGFNRGSRKIYKHGNYVFYYSFVKQDYQITRKGESEVIATASSIKHARNKIRGIQKDEGLMPPERKSKEDILLDEQLEIEANFYKDPNNEMYNENI
jgi:hypothetical protein